MNCPKYNTKCRQNRKNPDIQARAEKTMRIAFPKFPYFMRTKSRGAASVK